jgi:hypothetical protein
VLINSSSKLTSNLLKPSHSNEQYLSGKVFYSNTCYTKYIIMDQLSFNSKYACIEEMLKDRQYCLRLMRLSWFRKREEYPIVRRKYGHSQCGGELIKGRDEIESYMPCDRAWCRLDKSCCYKTVFKYECSVCGYFEIRK